MDMMEPRPFAFIHMSLHHHKAMSLPVRPGPFPGARGPSRVKSGPEARLH